MNNIGFADRHNGSDDFNAKHMLNFLGFDDMDGFIKSVVPEPIYRYSALAMPEPLSESEYIGKIKTIAAKNKPRKQFIGQGYYGCTLPPVIQRNVLENPAWYTAYTPYQPEIAQGRLEALINFQTMVCDLSKMEIANASLLDEATAAAEAMSMFYGSRKGSKKKSNKFLIDQDCYPQTIEVLMGRASSRGIEIEVIAIDDVKDVGDVFGVYFQHVDKWGSVKNRKELSATLSNQNIQIAVGGDLMALALHESPGEWGVDVVLGTSQRMGIPLGFGGPHAAFFATKSSYKRNIPGRIIGVSKDLHGKLAYRMALQTREQHIRREKATSNICTAQVLLAVISSMYAVYHGPKGIQGIALGIHQKAVAVQQTLKGLGIDQQNKVFFDTLRFETDNPLEIQKRAEEKELNLLTIGNDIVVAFDESHTEEDINNILYVISGSKPELKSPSIDQSGFREVDYLQHPVFNQYHTEHEMLRYMKSLENRDLSLVHSMIALGSCTMKLNATTEMMAIGFDGFANIHPYAPNSQVLGYAELLDELGKWLTDITEFDAISFQPNSGAQGEYTGLAVISAYLSSRGEHQRRKVLIPSSAHGTNPASAVMAGFEVVIVACLDNGKIDMEDLRAKAVKSGGELAALMVTYPSTHGLFEPEILEICKVIHDNGGQVYMDGANMNAQVGLTSPRRIGADVCHLNLHKTFCIPHGGGGPGMGPIGVAAHLAPFLPKNPREREDSQGILPIAAAKFGSAMILPISHAFISMMGSKGLKNATQLAILNANYIKKKLEGAYEILYTHDNHTVAHEFIVDCRPFKKVGIEVEDIAKRLMDYGYHAPTVSFPVAGTIMIEPTESETKQEMDTFCEALLSIREEIREVEHGKVDVNNNLLKNAPHTASVLVDEAWEKPYSRERAVFPTLRTKANKFWPYTSRIDGAFGDRNLMCSCIPVEEYAS